MAKATTFDKPFSMKMTADQAARLKAEAARQQTTVSELLRRFALTFPKVEKEVKTEQK